MDFQHVDKTNEKIHASVESRRLDTHGPCAPIKRKEGQFWEMANGAKLEETIPDDIELRFKSNDPAHT